MKIELNVHTLGKSGYSDRISVGVIVGSSCYTADLPTVLMTKKKKRKKKKAGLWIIGFSEASLPFFREGHHHLEKMLIFPNTSPTSLAVDPKLFGEMSQRGKEGQRYV